MTVARVLAVCLAVLAVWGCLPERVSWSPDGTRGLVLGDDGLHVCDVEGKLSGLMIEGATQAAWMPEGKRVVAMRMVLLKRWDEIAATFPEAAADAEKRAGELSKSLEEFKGDLKTWVDGHVNDIALCYLREKKPEAIKTKLGPVWESVMAAGVRTYRTQIFDVSGKEARPGAVLMDKPYSGAFFHFRVSPTGKAVAITWTPEESKDTEMVVVATESSAILFKTSAGWFPDWSADGKYLYYFRPPVKGNGWDDRGFLVRLCLTDGAGALVEAGKAGAEEQLVGVMYNAQSRVRVLKDGSVIFSADEVSLPEVFAGGKENSPKLFLKEPGEPITRLYPKAGEKDNQDLGDGMAYFEVSRDGSLISIPGENGRVIVVNRKTRAVEIVQDEDLGAAGHAHGHGLTSVPAWRTGDELTFVRSSKGRKANEVVRYSMKDGKATVISVGWPAEVTKGWLEKQE